MAMVTDQPPSAAVYPAGELPRRTREYHNHHFNSSIWDGIVPRPDDIIITTAYKSGTTWTQQIVATLLFAGEELPEPLSRLSPWVDLRGASADMKLAKLAAQPHRRIMKTHLPLDGIRFFPECKYVYVARDGRDVFMSLWNHYSKASDAYLDSINAKEGLVGPPLARCPGDIHQLWAGWVSRGSFAWEGDGYPYWSMFHHLATWWAYRHLSNIRFVHFANLKRDLVGEMRGIAAFLDIEIDEGKLPKMVEMCSFDYMKKNAASIVPNAEESWRGGAKTFIHKGTDGRWRGVLTDDELAQYGELVAKRLPADCAHWLATGEWP